MPIIPPSPLKDHKDYLFKYSLITFSVLLTVPSKVTWVAENVKEKKKRVSMVHFMFRPC